VHRLLQSSTPHQQVLVKSGEGIMLRQPKSLYEHNRSHTLLKVKFFHDEEAKVTGHENGSGRLQHLMGKIHCNVGPLQHPRRHKLLRCSASSAT
jgi:ATP-dependent DNA ligase